MVLRVLAENCTPRDSVFDPAIRDTVYNIDDLHKIDARRFFTENYVTEGMRQLLSEAFKRLEGESQAASGTFLLSQSMGGGKTHNLIALGLLAKEPALREEVMRDFYQSGPLGTVRVVTFSGRKTNTPFGIWGEIAEQLHRKALFNPFYGPLQSPGDGDWVELLRGEPTLILLDELPPYFEAVRAVPVGATSLDVITTTALANLLVAVSSGKLPNACVVLTDLSASAYGMGSAAMNTALRNLVKETGRGVTPIDPVRLASDELYHVLRTRLFEQVPSNLEIEAVADAYAKAVDKAHAMDITTASPNELRTQIRSSYPFHPAIRDLFARFKENPNFQQTRALIRIMRGVVAALWGPGGSAGWKHLVAAHDLNLANAEMMSEIRQINPSLESAIAHDIATEGRTAVAQQLDGPGQTSAQDAATLIFLSSLSQAVSPTLGLNRSELVACLVAPGRDVTTLRGALDQLQGRAWYLHATSGGALLFRSVENLNAKLESYAQGMLNEERESELRDQLREMFKSKTGAIYQEVLPLPALDQVQPTQDRVSLVIFRPSALALAEIRQFYDHLQFKNRVLFLGGDQARYGRVLERSAYLRAIRQIIKEFGQAGIRESEPQFESARNIETREVANFYLACRETFQQLHYPSKSGLIPLPLDPKYVANTYEGETQILKALQEAYKFKAEADATADAPGFRTSLENKLWPGGKEAAWAEIKRRAATDPSWGWHHPRALDDLRDELIRRDLWRDLGGGFVQRGPFPPPKPGVTVQQLSRDPQTGEVKLRIKPLHADTVYVTRDDQPGVQLDNYDVTTRATKLSFLPVSTEGVREEGDAYTWMNTIEVKHRFFEQDGARMCELQAVPTGEIRYTTDGSSPETFGLPYSEPFVVPESARMLLAVASDDGVNSKPLQVDVPRGKGGSGRFLDMRKPAIWRRKLQLDSRGETYQFLDHAGKHGAQLGGLALVVVKEQRYVDLRTDDKTFQEAAAVRDLATRLAEIVPGGALTLEVEALQFAEGQQLHDLAVDLRETIDMKQVEQ